MEISQNIAEQEISPKLIVFDLDLTLWPFHTDRCQRPFQFVSMGKVKDLDGNEYTLYPEVLDILLELTSKNYTLAIASRIKDISTAYQLLIYFNISHFFKYKEIYPCAKTVHFNWLRLKSHIPLSQMIFYDDDKRNIRIVAKLGVHTHHIKDNKGISYENLRLSNIKL